MTIIAMRQLAEQGQDLVLRAQTALGSADDERVRAIGESLQRTAPDQPLRLVVTGEYNGGKSTILQALTGREDIYVDSDVATSEVTEYQWGSVLLVDTPGVKAGVREDHDTKAEQALRDADLALFVVTVDLFDDVTADHLRHVAFDLGKRRQLVVAVNKTATMKAPPGVRERAVRDVLGPQGSQVPVVECDALRYLRAQERGARREAESLPGNIGALGEALNSLAAGRGEQGRLRRPFDAVIATVADAQPYLGEDPAERALQGLIARRRQIILSSQRRLDQTLDDLYGRAQDSVNRAGAQVIDGLDSDGVAEKSAVDAFESEYRLVSDQLGKAVTGAIASEGELLEADLADLARGPQMRTLRELSVVQIDVTEGATPDLTAAQPEGKPGGGTWDLIGQQVSTWGRTMLGDAVAKGARPGSPMHSVVKTVGHSFGHKFKPWQIVRVTKGVNVAITVGLFAFEAYAAYRALNAQERRDSALVAQMSHRVREVAERLTREADEMVREDLNDFYEGLLDDVMTSERELSAAVERKKALADSLERLDEEARQALSGLDDLSVQERTDS